jgi:hypothetical protein
MAGLDSVALIMNLIALRLPKASGERATCVQAVVKQLAMRPPT